MNNIPTITKNLLIVNVVVFLATYLFRNMGVDLNNVLGLHFFLAPDFHIYQLFTYMFAHGGFSHIFFNMFALWMFGCIVERTWGPKKFLTYYIVCGVGAGLFQELAQFAQFYFIASEQLPHFTLAQTMKVAMPMLPSLTFGPPWVHRVLSTAYCSPSVCSIPRSASLYSRCLCLSRQSGL